VKERLERQARNESLIRAVNERIEAVDKDSRERNFGPKGELFEFLCECGAGDAGCLERVRMTIDEYERVRQQDDRFAVVPGHENPELERVVERSDRFLVVDKISDAEHAVADDPRGAPSH
jgi:hypothetical protein